MSSNDRNLAKSPSKSVKRGHTDKTIGQYLIDRLRDYGIDDCFGIPGDYVLRFYSLLEESEINVVGCTREDCAGFAADAYARIHGMGALCVTYCVGGLSVANSIAGAFAEKSPVVMLTGDNSKSSVVTAIQHGVNDYIIKTSFNKLEFLQKISQQLQTKQQSQVASAEVPQQLEDHRQAEAVPVAAAPSEQQLQSILDN